MIVGLAALLAVALTGPAWGQAEPDGFQEDEQPGSEFELDVDDDGQVEFGRRAPWTRKKKARPSEPRKAIRCKSEAIPWATIR